MAQHRDMQQREMATDADLPLAGRPRLGKGAWIAGDDAVQHPVDGADMRLAMLFGRQREPVGRRDMLVHEQPLHHGRQCCGIARQAVEQARLLRRVGHVDRPAIELEAHGNRLSSVFSAWFQPPV